MAEDAVEVNESVAWIDEPEPDPEPIANEQMEEEEEEAAQDDGVPEEEAWNTVVEGLGNDGVEGRTKMT